MRLPPCARFPGHPQFLEGIARPEYNFHPGPLALGGAPWRLRQVMCRRAASGLNLERGMEDKGRVIFLNGRMLPYVEARIHVQSGAMKYAAAVFEGLRGYWNPEEEELYLFRVEAHAERLLRSLKLMRMDHPFDAVGLARAVRDLVRANGYREDVHIRQSAFIEGDEPMSATGPVGMAIAAYPLGRPKKSDVGLSCSVNSWARIDDAAMPPRIKCIANYQNGRLALLQARADGYDTTILLNRRGKVAEGPGACFFLVRDGVPITPPVTADILESITRRTLIQLFGEEHGIEAQEREVDRTEIYVGDEAFLCGTAWEVSPLVSMDRYPIGDGRVGPVTAAIAKTYFQVVRGGSKKYREWLTPVYGGETGT